MRHYHAGYFRDKEGIGGKKGQMQIQQMAFVLIAIVVFFAMVALVYISIRMSGLKEDVMTLREQEAKELVRKMASTPEFYWSESCQNCMDIDKVFLLKERKAYGSFWNLDYLAVEVLYPAKEGECTKENYPDCKKIIVLNKSSEIGTPSFAYVSLCRWNENGGYEKCELGRVYASGRGIK